MSIIYMTLSALLDAGILCGLLVLGTRIVGLRAFSKMSGYDFAITVAMGSVLAGSVLTAGVDALHGGIAIVVLFAVQMVLSRLRIHTWAGQAMDNAPLLIMEKGEIFEDNLRAAKMTRGDLIGKLREANALNFDEVHAVIFEATGDVSVLHGDSALDGRLLDGVRRAI